MLQLKKSKIAASLALILLFGFDCTSAWSVARKRSASAAPAGGVTLQTPNPTDPLQHNNRGVELGMKGMWPAAVHEHELALMGDPYNMTFRQNLSSAYQRYGQSLMSKKDYRDAIVKFHYAIYTDSENRDADELLSNAYKASGKNPDDASFRQSEADKFDSNGDYVQAIAEYKHYVRMKDNGAAHFALGRVLVKQGSSVPAKLVEGFAELKVALVKPWEASEKTEVSKCHALLGDILKDMANVAQQDGRSEVAMTRLANAGIEYRRAVMSNPLNTDAIRGLIEVSRLAVSLNPSFDNHLMLAGAYQLLPDFERAKHEYEECYKLNKSSPALAQARLSFHLAVVSSSTASQTMIATSMQKIEDQLRAKPHDALLLYIYGRGKEAQGDVESAARAYEAAANIDANIHPQLSPRLAALRGGTTLGATPGATGVGAYQGQHAAPAGSLNSSGVLAGTPPGAAASNPIAGLSTSAPRTPAAQYANYESLIQAGKLDDAITGLRAQIDKSPQDGQAWYILGEANEKKGDLEEASIDYRQATYTKVPGSDAALTRVNNLRAEPMLKDADLKLASKDFVGAASSVKDALLVAPQNSGYHRKLQQIYKQMGDTKEADREEQKANDIDKPPSN